MLGSKPAIGAGAALAIGPWADVANEGNVIWPIGAFAALACGYASSPMIGMSGGDVVMEWWELAACARGEAERFFPEGRAIQRQIDAAKAVCAGCPVRSRCLSWALSMDVAGVWGGSSHRERRMMRREITKLSTLVAA